MDAKSKRRWYEFSLRARLIAATVVVVVLLGRLAYQNTTTSLENPEKLILYSLDFREEYMDEGFPQTEDMFRGIPVMGKIEVKDARKRKEIIAAINAGTAESDGDMAKCFYPRHAIRATENGREVEYLICFECMQLQVYLNGFRQPAMVPTTRGPQSVVNRHLKDANVPISPEALEMERP